MRKQVVAERLLYLPSAGFCVICAHAWAELLEPGGQAASEPTPRSSQGGGTGTCGEWRSKGVRDSPGGRRDVSTGSVCKMETVDSHTVGRSARGSKDARKADGESVGGKGGGGGYVEESSALAEREYRTWRMVMGIGIAGGLCLAYATVSTLVIRLSMRYTPSLQNNSFMSIMRLQTSVCSIRECELLVNVPCHVTPTEHASNSCMSYI